LIDGVRGKRRPTVNFAHVDLSCLDGVDYWLNGWLRKTKDGKPYLSLSFKKKIPEAAGRGESRQVHFNDEVPFAPEVR
jgi:hypothetical protein